MWRDEPRWEVLEESTAGVPKRAICAVVAVVSPRQQPYVCLSVTPDFDDVTGVQSERLMQVVAHPNSSLSMIAFTFRKASIGSAFSGHIPGLS
jgi:hypothetical protein